MKKPKKNKPQAASGKSGDGSSPSVRRSTDTEPAVREPAVGDSGGEPVAGRAAVPALLVGLLGALIFFGDIYMLENGGRLDARVHQPFRFAKDFEDLAPKSPEEIVKAKGRKVYKDYCSPCHMDDGNGNSSGFIPPLAASDWVVPKDPSRIIRIVLNGLSGPIMVNQKPYGQTAMLAWRGTLTDEDIAAALTYVRSSWGNKAPAVKADEVKKLRDETAAKGDANWTADELLKIPLKN